MTPIGSRPEAGIGASTPAGWEVRRAWPDGSGLTLELIDPAGRVRAGRQDADGTTELAPMGTDPRLPALATVVDAAGGPSRLVSHRWGRRAVVRGERTFTRVLRPARATRAAARHRLVATTVAGTPLSVPDLVAHDEVNGTMAVSELGGSPLLEHPDPVAAAGLLAAAVARWRQQCAPAPALGRHDADDERTVLARWAATAIEHGLVPAADRRTFDRALSSARSALADLGPRPLALSHRDLHDGQALVGGDGAGLLDLDTATHADPALDLGNLRTHIDLAEASGRIDRATAHAVAVALTRSWDLDGPGDDAAGAAYHAAARVRLVAVHAFRPATAAPARSLLDAWR